MTIGLSPSDPTEGTVSSPSLTFTTANWNAAQTVTVTGVDDVLDDGDVAYTIVTAAATSADPIYNGLDAADVAVTNTDNDAAGITVTPTSGLTTTEAGGTATFTVVLTSQPTADVTIALSSSDPTEGTVSPASVGFTGVVTFTGANWNTPQTITVTGVDDALDDGDIAYTIVTAPATSTDATYNGVDAADVAGDQHRQRRRGHHGHADRRADDDRSRAGRRRSRSCSTAQPTADVTIALSSSDTTEGHGRARRA